MVPPQGGRKHPDQKMIAVNTKNILYICGGAFDGIEKKIALRLNTQVVGYGADKKRQEIDRNNMLQYISPPGSKGVRSYSGNYRSVTVTYLFRPVG